MASIRIHYSSMHLRTRGSIRHKVVRAFRLASRAVVLMNDPCILLGGYNRLISAATILACDWSWAAPANEGYPGITEKYVQCRLDDIRICGNEFHLLYHKRFANYYSIASPCTSVLWCHMHFYIAAHCNESPAGTLYHWPSSHPSMIPNIPISNRCISSICGNYSSIWEITANCIFDV